MADTNNVTYAKPKVGGAVYIAPLGTDLPTDAQSTLGTEFKALGYISDDGLTNSLSTDSDDIKAWGGDTVLKLITGTTDEFKATFIESLNVEVLKMVYGTANVTGDLASGIEVKANGNEKPSTAWVIETIGRGGVAHRIVVPNGKAIVDGDITYKDDEARGFETTISALPDENGNTHYEYIVKSA